MRLVELFRAVDDGTLPLDHACQRASKLGAEHAITPAALEALSEEAFKRAPVSWRQAWSLSRIVYAAADASWSPGDAAYGLRVELLAPASGPVAMQRLIGLTLAHQVRHGTSTEEVQLLMQAAKGRLFAATLAHGTAGWVPDCETRRLLAEANRAEERLPSDRPLLEPPRWAEALDEDDLVTAYASEFELSPSDTPEGAVVNQQRAVERHIVAAIAPADAYAAAPSPLAEIRGALDARTVLLMLYEGPWVDGRFAAYSLLATAEQEYFAMTTIGVPEAELVSLTLRPERRETLGTADEVRAQPDRVAFHGRFRSTAR